MNTLTRKLDELEKCAVNCFPDSAETFLWVNNEAEQTLYAFAREIVACQQKQFEHLEANQKIHPTTDPALEKTVATLSDEQEAVLCQVERLSFQRAFHIFERVIAVHYHQNDPECKALFRLRFFWFLSEMQDMTKHLLWEKQIINESDFYDLCMGEQDVKLKPCVASWREWFTKESYQNWLKTLPTYDVEPKTSEEATLEAVEEAALIEEELQIEEERDNRYLREKCPTCPTKCKWCNEQN